MYENIYIVRERDEMYIWRPDMHREYTFSMRASLHLYVYVHIGR